MYSYFTKKELLLVKLAFQEEGHLNKRHEIT